MTRFLTSFVLLIVLMGHDATYGQVELTNAFPSLTFTRPIFLTHAGDGTNRVFVAQQDGLIMVFLNDSAVTSPTVFLNITDKLSNTRREEGLLGLAFHPEYSANGWFYVNYTTPNPLRTIIARYTVMQNDPDKADSLSEQIILSIDQPYGNHNGGMILFGGDGYLYIGMGDGGSAGDPDDNGQNLQSLLGKMLRIDINTDENYLIPPTNPFHGNPTAGREELFAWGLRNPWRFSEDTTSGLMLIGDVGQGLWEEIDDLSIGANYGWRCYEGNVPYDTTGCGLISDYTFPIKVYPHADGDCSITGGYIYRGYRRSELTGAYIYGDYCTGKIWLLRYENGQVTEDSLLIDAPFAISSFGVDRDGELYVCNYDGEIHRFTGPSLPAIPCDAIGFFNAKCNANGAAQAMVKLFNSTEYAGENVEFQLDDSVYSVELITNGTHTIGRLQVPQAGYGQHTITLVNPGGCYDPITFNCQVDGAIADPEFDAEWAEFDAQETSVAEPLPKKTRLIGNYPNPFNPVTTISYELPVNTHVTLTVIDIVGREVARLVDGYQEAGYKNALFDASNLASGIYFYRLQAGGFVEARKLILMK